MKRVSSTRHSLCHIDPLMTIQKFQHAPKQAVTQPVSAKWFRSRDLGGLLILDEPFQTTIGTDRWWPKNLISWSQILFIEFIEKCFSREWTYFSFYLLINSLQKCSQTVMPFTQCKLHLLYSIANTVLEILHFETGFQKLESQMTPIF